MQLWHFQQFIEEKLEFEHNTLRGILTLIISESGNYIGRRETKYNLLHLPTPIYLHVQKNPEKLTSV